MVQQTVLMATRLALQTGQAEIAQNEVAGGGIGGALKYQNTVLRQTQNELGRLAIVMSSVINQQLSQGEDLNGNPGSSLFTDMTSPSGAVMPLDDISTAVSGLTIVDSGQLQASEYDFRIDSAGNYVISRLNDQTQWTGTLSGTGVETIVFDGVEVTVDGAATDQAYHFAPTRYGAREFGVVLSDPSALAFAATGRKCCGQQ